MVVETWLAEATAQLRKVGIETARLDSLVLLEDCLDTNRAQLLAHPELVLSKEHINVLSKQVARRALHEPLAYIRGKVEFYGRDFIVSPAVLVPRPESETMITLVKNLLEDSPLARKTKPIRIADVGTGSGALGITANLEVPGATVELIDIDASALEIAKRNVIKFTSDVSVIKSDLLEQAGSYDVLLCNLPYVPDSYTINQAAMAEPGLAIFGGEDGLDLYRRLFGQIARLQNQPLLILTESLPFQHPALKQIADDAGYGQVGLDDFIQVFRLS